MRSIAVLGASGFIGSRLVETLHLGRMADVRPVLRAPASLARLSRFDLDARVADARDQSSLAAAFVGCDAVVHAVSGGPELILGSLEPVYRAAEAAGVRRMIYLSSASVHGQAPRPGTNEKSPLDPKQPLPYNAAKIRAERVLQRLRDRGRVELVILRPGIVFGPRSQWVTGFADALLSGSAYVVHEGRGVCNSIYVDNLVHGIEQAIAAAGADREAFLLGDEEEVTWLDLYAPIAEGLGIAMDCVPSVDAAREPTWMNRLTTVARSRRALSSLVPARLRRTVAPSLQKRKRGHAAGRSGSKPRATLEMTLLHGCRYKLPHEKARRLLDYQPPVSFQEGCRRTIGWMQFAGYPVRKTHDVAIACSGD